MQNSRRMTINQKKAVDELIENIYNIDHIYPKLIPLMSSKEKLKCQTFVCFAVLCPKSTNST